MSEPNILTLAAGAGSVALYFGFNTLVVFGAVMALLFILRVRQEEQRSQEKSSLDAECDNSN